MLVVAGIFVFLGWRSGLSGQILRIVAALAVVFGAAHAAVVVREAVFGSSELSEPIVEVASLFMAALGLYVGISLAGWLAIRAMRAASGTLSTMDRLGGASLGLLKAVLIVYVLVVGVSLLEVPLQRVDPDNVVHLRGGWSTENVKRHNVLAPWQFPDLATFHEVLVVAKAAEEGAVADELRTIYPRSADLLRDERLEPLVADEDLVEAATYDDWAISLADERVRELLDDDAFVDDMNAIEWTAIREHVAPRPDAETTTERLQRVVGDAIPPED